MSETMDVMEVFQKLPEREQKLVLARAWILKNDHFLLPLDGESDFNHHARILMTYAFQYNYDLTIRLAKAERERDIYKRAVEHYADVGFGVAQAALKEAEEK